MKRILDSKLFLVCFIADEDDISILTSTISFDAHVLQVRWIQFNHCCISQLLINASRFFVGALIQLIFHSS